MPKKGQNWVNVVKKRPPNSSAATGLFRAGFIPSKPATALQQAEGWILQMKSILFFWQHCIANVFSLYKFRVQT